MTPPRDDSLPDPESDEAGAPNTEDGKALMVTTPKNEPELVASTSRRLSPRQMLAVTRERLLWNRRAESWDTEGSAGLTKIVDAVLKECERSAGGIAVDLGCGSGQLTIPLAPSCSRVLAVDVSARVIALLEAKSAEGSIENIQAVIHPIESLELASASVDLIVSNYALHHLRDKDKAEVMRRSYRWLRPGGRLVVGDMMFGRGADRVDREIITKKVRSMIRRGPAGWWRLAKNIWRFSLRLGERPLPAARWELLARQAGFLEIRTERVVAEACVLSATKPPASDAPNAARPDSVPLHQRPGA